MNKPRNIPLTSGKNVHLLNSIATSADLINGINGRERPGFFHYKKEGNTSFSASW